MKRILQASLLHPKNLLWIGLFFIVGLLSCNTNSPSTEAASSTSPKKVKTKADVLAAKKVGQVLLNEYQPASERYRVLLPNLWMKEFNDKTGTVIAREEKDDNENDFTDFVRIIYYQGPDFFDKEKNKMVQKPIDLAKLASAFRINAIETLLGYEQVEEENFGTSSPEKAGQLTFNYKDKVTGKKLRAKASIKSNQYDAALIIGHTPTKDFDAFEPIVQEIVESITFER